METEDNYIDNKKRLMFVKGEDFYFLTYNILLILKVLKCNCGVRKFKDYRKLAFLIDFVSDYNLINIIKNGSQRDLLNVLDRDLLMRTYSNGMIRQNELIKLLFTLEKNKFITLEKEGDTNLVSVCINIENIPIDFLGDNDNIFQSEIININTLKSQIQRLTNTNLDHMLQKLFDNYGIKRWAV
jgi:hypothetical protein